jgi:hypothetical protein
MNNQWRSGEWHALCDYCGFQFYASELQQDQWGFRSCKKDFSTKNPQEFVRPKTETINVPWTRPDDTGGDIAKTNCVNLTPKAIPASLVDTVVYLAPTGAGTSHAAILPDPNSATFLGVSVIYLLYVVAADTGSVEDSIGISTAAGAIDGPTTEIPFNGMAKYRNVPSQNLWIRE